MAGIIENEEAYNRAIARKMKENSRKTNLTKWIAEDSSRAELVAYLENNWHRNDFLENMMRSYNDWGKLTPKQEDAVRVTFTKYQEKQKIFDEERAKVAAVSQHVGTAKERLTFVANVLNIIEFDDEIYGGIVRLYTFEDENGNHFITKRNGCLFKEDINNNTRYVKKGDKIKIRGTVKNHGEYKGVKQTDLSRVSLLQYMEE